MRVFKTTCPVLRSVFENFPPTAFEGIGGGGGGRGGGAGGAKGAIVQLISSVILSTLDYCDSLLAGLPSNELSCL